MALQDTEKPPNSLAEKDAATADEHHHHHPDSPVTAGEKLGLTLSSEQKEAGETTTGTNTDKETGHGDDTNDDEGDGTPEPDYLEGTKLLVVMAGITIVISLAMIDITIVSTAIPQITSDFHRLEDVGWYVAAYQLASSTVQPLTGKIYTYFNTKWSYLAFFFVFELGSVICGAANSSTMLIVGRAVAGLGSSGLINGTLTILGAAIRPDKRPFYNGIAFGLSQIGIVAGPLLGGVFTQYATWRWCFWINLPLGAVAGIFVAFITIRDQTPKPPVTVAFLRSILPRFDLIGFALFAPASIMFLLALQFGAAEYGWGASEVIGLFCGSGATLLVFLAWEWKKGDDAMIPLRMVARTVIWSSTLNMGALMSTNVVAGGFFPIYFQSVRGLSPVMSGVYFLPGIFAQILAIVTSGALMVRLRYYIPWSVVAGAAVAVAAGLISTWDAHSSLGEVFGYQVLLGFRGTGMQVGILALQNNVKPSELAVANAILIFGQNFLAAVLVTVGNTVFHEGLVSSIKANVPSIDSQAAIAAGGSAEAVRSLAAPGSPELAALLEAYSVGVSYTVYLLLALGVLVVFTAFGMGWIDLSKSKTAKKKPAAGEA